MLEHFNPLLELELSTEEQIPLETIEMDSPDLQKNLNDDLKTEKDIVGYRFELKYKKFIGFIS